MKNEAKLALQSVQNLLDDVETIDNVITDFAQERISSKLTLEQVITDKQLHNVVRGIFDDGYHAQAVSQACKFLENLVRNESGVEDEIGEKLMRKVFSASNPVLKINEMITISQKNEQRGHMDLYVGLIAGIRNPRAHEHDWQDTELRAIQLLSFINYLVIRTRTAKNS